MAITQAQRIDLIELYVAIPGRAPDAGGLSFWSEKLVGGASLNTIAQEMWNSADAKALYPASLTVTETVSRIYQNVLGRTADTEGLNFWVGRWNANGPGNEGKTLLEMVDAINDYNGTDADALASKALFQNKVAFGEWFAITLGSNDLVLAKQGFDVLQSGGSVADAQAAVQAVAGETKILTGTTDVITTGAGDDEFVATDSTLNSSDRLNGGDGDDVLTVNVENGDFFVAPTLSNIEKISVTAGGSNWLEGDFDLSRATGYEVLELFQNEEVNFMWSDIQNVNGTELSIIDTWGEDSDIDYVYDTNAYAPGNGIDTARLTVAEVGSLANQVGPRIHFFNETPDWSPSSIDVVDLQSLWNGQVNDTTGNYIDEMLVGGQFRTLLIGGNDAGSLGLPESTTNTDGNLEIERFLDASVRLIDARELNANLTLDVDGNQGTNGDATEGVYANNGRTFSEAITIYGAQGNDLISIKDSTNALINLGTGNDTLVIGSSNDLSDTFARDQNVQGHQTIDTGAGNDAVYANLTGIQSIALGTGNDLLELIGDVDNRLTSIYGDGVSTVNAGDGADTVSLTALTQVNNEYLIDLGTGNDRLTVNSNGNQTVTAGAGDDSVAITGNGSNSIDGGAGADTISVTGDGNQTIVSGPDDATDGNDRVTITGTGVHNVKLGDGNDVLAINGAWNADNNFDYGDDDVTHIDAGAGNDTISVSLNHFLNVKMGAGNDQITLRATDLTVDDAIAGDAGTDTIILTNAGGQDVFLRDSETSSVTGVERFDLRDSGITLHITKELHDTAEGNDITVITEQSTGKIDLPKLTLLNVSQPLKAANADAVAADLANLADNATINAFSQGMSREDWDAIVEDWEDGIYAEAWQYGTTEADLVEFLLSKGVQQIHFVNADNIGNDSDNVSTVRAPIDGTDEDEVYFITNLAPAQTIDITDAPLSLANGRNFTLLGGTIKDIVIGNEASINGRADLRFDGFGQSNSIEDTLVVVGSAQLNAADLRNVSGLEIIELTSETSAVQTWTIDLTDQVINQTTGLADLVIRVDDRVPAGSKLIIKTDSTVPSATNGVRIETSGNLIVEVNGKIVGESDYNAPLSAGNGYGSVGNVITVVGQLNFTSAQDSLIGTGGPDTFHAEFIAQIQNGDSADGLGNVGGFDQLIVDEKISNPTGTVFSAFGGASITNIEKLVFNTSDNVQVLGLGGYGFSTVQTGAGQDAIGAADANVEWWMGAGADTVTLSQAGDFNNFWIDGEAGSDLVVGGEDSETINLSSVETVNAGAGNDFISFHYRSGNDGNISVNGGTGADTLHLDDNGTNGTATVVGVEVIFGGDASDTIVASNAGGAILIWGDDNDGIAGEADNITVTAATSATVNGEHGNDTITVGSGTFVTSNVGIAVVDGGSGADTISVTVTGSAQVQGGSEDDVITVVTGDDAVVSGGTGADTITVTVQDDAVVAGNDGNDVITVSAQDASVDGGIGNDRITVTYGTTNDPGDFETAAVDGGEGADTITIIEGANADGSTITGGAGNDVINLSGAIAGDDDTLVFGTIVYNALQVQTSNTQGYDVINNFNWEAGGPGAEDLLDFDDFLGYNFANADFNGTGGFFDGGLGSRDLGVRWDNWLGGPNTLDMDGAGNDIDAGIAVIAAQNGFQLTSANISEGTGGTIQIDDGGRAVVIIAQDSNGNAGFDKFDVYFVQDLDSDAGTYWAVDLVATINSITEIGAINDTTIGSNHFV